MSDYLTLSKRGNNQTVSNFSITVYIQPIETVYIQPIEEEHDRQINIISAKCTGKLFPCD